MRLLPAWKISTVAIPFAACLACTSPSAIVAGDEITKSRDAAESEETTRLIKAELPNWKLWSGADRQMELKLEPKSVLRWTNPGTGRVYGDLYLWTAGGRPEVAMSLFKTWDPPHGFHVEMHSLSLASVEAERAGTIIWQPAKSGITLKNVPGAPAPAESAIRRMSQMRAMALEFSAVLTDFRRNDKGERQALRMLTQPMYRYESSDPALLDGALFAFVLGTDPEVFLMLEARGTTGARRWQYGLARMNNDSLIVQHNETEVWRIQRAELQDQLHGSYVLTRIPETP